MVSVKRLTIQGFKSFGKFTSIEFPPGFTAIVGPNGSGKCVTGNTLVTLADGSLQPIKDVVERRLKGNYPSKKLDDGEIAYVNDLDLLSIDSDLKLRKKKAVAVVKREAPNKMLRVTFRSGRSVTTTPYHPLFTINNGHFKSVKAEKLKVGTRIATPRVVRHDKRKNQFIDLTELFRDDDGIYFPYSDHVCCLFRDYKRANKLTWKEFASECSVPYMFVKGFVDGQSINIAHLFKILKKIGHSPTEISEIVVSIKSKNQKKCMRVPWRASPELYRLLGYLISEGRTTRSNQVWFVNADKSIIRDFRRLAKELFGLDAKVFDYKKGTSDVIIFSSILCKYLEKVLDLRIESRSRQKRVPDILFSSSREEITSFLEGLLSGDGYISPSSVDYTSASKELVSGMQELFLRLGIISSSRKKEKYASNTKKKTRRTYYELSIYGVKNFRKMRGFNLGARRKQERLARLIKKKNDPNPNLDIVPNMTGVVKELRDKYTVNVKKVRKKHPRFAAYAERRCEASRGGLLEAASVFKSHGANKEDLKKLEYCAKSDIYWDEITKVEKVGPKEKWVYDLCVSDTHNFVADGCVVHNSNVIDSLCFVLGRTSVKSLRAGRLTELIFNGGQDGKPAGRAEVGIKFDNSSGEIPLPDKEVEVVREIHKDGKSVYRINGKRSTRAQIADLLSKARISSSGHNIILQGDVARIVEMNALQRREIIDEICGIAEYEAKKSRATRELEKVQGKIGEAMAIFRERKKYLDSYERERNTALRYQEVNKKLKGYRSEIYQIKIKKAKKELELIGKDGQEYEEKKRKFDEERSQRQEEVDGLQGEINAIDAQIAAGHESKYGKEIQELRVKIGGLEEKKKLLGEQKGALDSQLGEMESEVNEIMGRQEGAKDELDELRAKKEGLKKELSEATAEVKKLRDKIMSGGKDVREKIGKLREEVDEKREKLHEAQKDIERLKEFVRVKEEERAGIDIEGTKAEISGLQKERGDAEKMIAALEKEVKGLEEEISVKIDSISEKEGALAESDAEFDRLEKLRARLNAEYEAYKSGAGLARAAKEVIEAGIDGVVGTVAELGEVPEEYDAAIKAAAGRRLENVVVRDDKVAEKCIAYLKENDIGRATFLPLNKIRGEAPGKSPENSTDYAYNLVKHSEEYDGVFAYVFGDSLVVGDIEKARALGIGKERMVTHDGALFEKGGAMSGGSKAGGVGFKSEGLEEKLASANGDVDALEGKRLELRSAIDVLRKELAADDVTLREKTRELERAAGGLEGLGRKLESLEGLGGENRAKEIESRIAESSTELKKLTEDEDGLNAEFEKGMAQLSELEERVGIKDVDKFNQEMEEKEAIVSGLQEDYNDAGARYSALQSRLESLVGKELEDRKKAVEKSRESLDAVKRGMAEIVKMLGEGGKELDGLIKKEEEESGIRGLVDAKKSLSEKIEKARNAVQECYKKLADLERNNSELAARKATIETRMTDLKAEYPELEGQQIEIKHGESELERLIGKYEKELAEIGSVNMLAIEAYDKIKEDFDELVKKMEKLEEEKAAVERFMEDIEEKKKDAFMTTFLEILDKFEKTYGRLDPGGEAHLILENPDSPFEAGMEIQVRPRGKDLINIDALSGGEKTMTALAFIFAIQQYRPAPFYILDEVDAALDKMNSQMLGEMLAEYAKSGIAQFIIITHNDSVLEKADRLYGVTMTPRGSQIVGVEIGELPAGSAEEAETGTGSSGVGAEAEPASSEAAGEMLGTEGVKAEREDAEALEEANN